MGLDNPLRIDFFGNKIESIRSFNPISQISMKNFNKVLLSSSLESPRSKKYNQNFTENYRNLFGPSASDQLFIHKLKNDIRADGIENWLPLFYSDNLSIIDFFDIK